MNNNFKETLPVQITKNQISKVLKEWTNDIDNTFNTSKVCIEMLHSLTSRIYDDMDNVKNVELKSANHHMIQIELEDFIIDISTGIDNALYINILLYDKMTHNGCFYKIPINTYNNIHVDQFPAGFIDSHKYIANKINEIICSYIWNTDYKIPGYTAFHEVEKVFSLYKNKIDTNISLLRKRYKDIRYILKNIMHRLPEARSFCYISNNSFVIDICDGTTISVIASIHPNCFGKHFRFNCDINMSLVFKVDNTVRMMLNMENLEPLMYHPSENYDGKEVILHIKNILENI